MSTKAAKDHALTAQKSGHEKDKLDYIAKAIFELVPGIRVE